MQISLDHLDPTPIFAQLDRAVRAAIAVGALAPGERLPTVRKLAGELGVNPNTVARAYGELQRAGVLVARRGAGTFVSETPPAHNPLSRRDRERELRVLVDRLLADASAIGVSLPEVLHYLRSLDAQLAEQKG